MTCHPPEAATHGWTGQVAGPVERADILVGHQAISTVKPTDSQVLDNRGSYTPWICLSHIWFNSVARNQQVAGSRIPAGSFIQLIT